MGINTHNNESPDESDSNSYAYLIPEISFNLFENEDAPRIGFEDELMYQLAEREEFVMSVLQSLKEQGLENTQPFLLYQTELFMMLALENHHRELLQHEEFDDDDIEEEDNDDDGN